MTSTGPEPYRAMDDPERESYRAIFIAVFENLDVGRKRRLLDHMRQPLEEQGTERRLSDSWYPFEDYWRWRLKGLT